MILEVDDNGRLERVLVIEDPPKGTTDERRFIGGYRLHTNYLEGVWFDLAVWDTALISEDEYFKTYRLTRKAS
nr:MAG TPA: hypothetical protein [Siphovirus LN-2020-1]